MSPMSRLPARETREVSLTQFNGNDTKHAIIVIVAGLRTNVPPWRTYLCQFLVELRPPPPRSPLNPTPPGLIFFSSPSSSIFRHWAWPRFVVDECCLFVSCWWMDSGQETEPLGLRLNVNALPETDLVPAFAYLDVQQARAICRQKWSGFFLCFVFGGDIHSLCPACHIGPWTMTVVGLSVPLVLTVLSLFPAKRSPCCCYHW